MIKRISEQIGDFSKNLVESTADLVLFRIYLGTSWKTVGETSKLKNGGGDSPAFDQAQFEGLEGSFPPLPSLTPAKIARALRFCLKNNLIEIRSSGELAMTEAGGARLDQLFPAYQKERPWGKQIYLINYDIPVGKNSDRDALRLFLKEQLGCALLQSSVWITPFDPGKKMADFVRKRGLEERVVVSVLQGELDLAKVYGLDDLNRRYQEFIKGLEDREGPATFANVAGDKMRLAFDYFSILKDDPQIPFELLPKDWLGDRAQELFEGLFF